MHAKDDDPPRVEVQVTFTGPPKEHLEVEVGFRRQYQCHGFAIDAGGRCPECNAKVPL